MLGARNGAIKILPIIHRKIDTLTSSAGYFIL